MFLYGTIWISLPRNRGVRPINGRAHQRLNCDAQNHVDLVTTNVFE